MNNVIEFKKDCIMKTSIDEITDISVSHDYKILEDTIEGFFDVYGEYKLTKASVQKEEFAYTIPFTIALSSLIDRSSINITIKDFSYTVEKDILHLKMYLNMEYEELPEEDTLNENEEKEGDTLEMIDDLINSMNETKIEDKPIEVNPIVETTIKEEKIEKNETEDVIKDIIYDNEQNVYFKYKIYIMREEDTIESVAIKYNVTLDTLREYNDISNVNIGDKIIIPFINNVQD